MYFCSFFFKTFGDPFFVIMLGNLISWSPYHFFTQMQIDIHHCHQGPINSQIIASENRHHMECRLVKLSASLDRIWLRIEILLGTMLYLSYLSQGRISLA